MAPTPSASTSKVRARVEWLTKQSSQGRTVGGWDVAGDQRAEACPSPAVASMRFGFVSRVRSHRRRASVLTDDATRIHETIDLSGLERRDSIGADADPTSTLLFRSGGGDVGLLSRLSRQGLQERIVDGDVPRTLHTAVRSYSGGWLVWRRSARAGRARTPGRARRRAPSSRPGRRRGSSPACAPPGEYETHLAQGGRGYQCSHA